ncbi:FUSC family protein [Alloyangia pacifica]|uniref:FUSC family protein n=1 Tax=Alloyangia pacifica TaxID=311180 RepID=UPI001CD40A45|nr:FUSC family protein [Alloyangia pacifica]MCA0997350.1 FUSC family protein [Alloyangia pacifica]
MPALSEFARPLRVGAALTILILVSVMAELPASTRLPLLGSAFASCIGADWHLGGRRWPVVGIDVIGKVFGVLAGWAAGQVTLGGDMTLVLPGLFIGGALVGALTVMHQALWWALIQSFVFFGIAGVLAAQIDPLPTAGLVLLGSGLMSLWLELPNMLRQRHTRAEHPHPLQDAEAEIDHQDHGLILRMALIAGLSVGLAYCIALWTGLQRAYWAPLIVLFVLKPKSSDMRQAVLNRTVYTIIGAIAATALVMLLPPEHGLLYVLFVLTAMATIWFNGRNFRVFIALVTAGFILLVSMGFGGIVENAEARVYATLIGCAVTIVVAWLIRQVTHPAPA